MNYRDRALLDCAYSFPCLLRSECCEGGVASDVITVLRAAA